MLRIIFLYPIPFFLGIMFMMRGVELYVVVKLMIANKKIQIAVKFIDYRVLFV